MRLSKTYLSLGAFLLFCNVSLAQLTSIEDEANNNSNPDSSNCKEPKYGCGNTNRGITGFIFASDQDFLNLIGENRDANYTMGAQLLWIGEGTNSKSLGLPWILSGIDQGLYKELTKGLLSDNNKYLTEKFTSTFGFGVSAFTPEDLELVIPDTSDRPYSSTLFLKSGRVYWSSTNPWMLETSFTIDILGLKISEFVQTAIHSGQRASDSSARPNPMGWDNQISNGFGIFGSYEAMAYYPLEHLIKKDDYKTDCLTPYIGFGGSVGTYTRAKGTLGLILNLGQQHGTQTLPNNFGLMMGRQENAEKNSIVNEDGDYSSLKGGKSSFSFFIDAKVSGNLWAYNALLQGLPWEDVDTYTLRGSEIERFTILWDISANLSFRTNYLRVGFAGRTKEFDKSGALPHGWGTVAFGWKL